MGWGGKPASASAAAAAAAASAAAAAAAEEEASSRLPAHVAHGVRVTIGYFVLYYCFCYAQGTMKRKLRAYYAEQGKKFDRYFSRDRKMLGWDRIQGNMLEQMGPFLTLFWASILLSPFGGLPYVYVVAGGWLYVLLRAVYPMLWFAGGGGIGGSYSLIWRVTIPMYLIVLTFAINAATIVYGA